MGRLKQQQQINKKKWMVRLNNNSTKANIPKVKRGGGFMFISSHHTQRRENRNFKRKEKRSWGEMEVNSWPGANRSSQGCSNKRRLLIGATRAKAGCSEKVEVCQGMASGK